MNVGFVMYHSMKTVATETILFVRSRKKPKKGKVGIFHYSSQVLMCNNKSVKQDLTCFDLQS